MVCYTKVAVKSICSINIGITVPLVGLRIAFGQKGSP